MEVKQNDIVREQEDESLAKKLQYGFHNGHSNSVPSNKKSNTRREKKTEFENLINVHELDYERQLLLGVFLKLEKI